MPNRTRRREVLTGLALSGLGGLSGCLDEVPVVGTQQPEPTIGGTDRRLRLGVLLPLSGDLESLGVSMRNSALLPVEQVEDDAPFEFDVAVEDTETSPTAGTIAATRLVDAEYPMVTGPASSGVTLQATQQVLIPHRIATCSPASTTPTLTALNDIGLVYRTVASDRLQARMLADLAATDQGHDRVATLYVNNDYGWQLTQAFTRSFESDHGGTVIEQVPYEEGRSSYAEQIESALAADPELLIVIAYPESGARIFQGLAEADADQDILVTDSLRDGDLHDAVDHSLDGVRGTAPVADGPDIETFHDLYERQGYETGVTTFSAHSYDATAALLLANAYAGQNDGRAIAQALEVVTTEPGTTVSPSNLAEGLALAGEGEQVAYRGASGPIEFDQYGDTVAATFEYWEFDEAADGGIRELDRVSI